MQDRPQRTLTFLVTTLALVLASPVAGTEDEDSGAGAQARSFADLPRWVRLGDKVHVTVESGRQVDGTIERISSDENEIVLRVSGRPLTLSAREVQEIELEVGDSLGNGALYGLGTGVVIAAGYAAACQDDTYGTCFAGSALVFGGIGAAMGILVDSLRKEKRLIYSSSEHALLSDIRVAPLVSSELIGFAVRLSW